MLEPIQWSAAKRLFPDKMTVAQDVMKKNIPTEGGDSSKFKCLKAVKNVSNSNSHLENSNVNSQRSVNELTKPISDKEKESQILSSCFAGIKKTTSNQTSTVQISSANNFFHCSKSVPTNLPPAPPINKEALASDSRKSDKTVSTNKSFAQLVNGPTGVAAHKPVNKESVEKSPSHKGLNLNKNKPEKSHVKLGGFFDNIDISKLNKMQLKIYKQMCENAAAKAKSDAEEAERKSQEAAQEKLQNEKKAAQQLHNIQDRIKNIPTDKNGIPIPPPLPIEGKRSDSVKK